MCLITLMFLVNLCQGSQSEAEYSVLLASRDGPTDLNSVVSLAIVWDNCLQECYRQKAGHSRHSYTPCISPSSSLHQQTSPTLSLSNLSRSTCRDRFSFTMGHAHHASPRSNFTQRQSGLAGRHVCHQRRNFLLLYIDPTSHHRLSLKHRLAPRSILSDGRCS